MQSKQLVLYIVACGGYPAEDLPALVTWAKSEGWVVCVIATTMGLRFLDVPGLVELTERPVRFDYKQPDDPDVLPPADAYLIAPATFNSTNKLAAGASDTLALGLLNEAIGAGKPTIAVPWPNRDLAKRLVFRRSVAELRREGVRVVLDYERLPLPASGRSGASSFPWELIREELKVVRRELED